MKFLSLILDFLFGKDPKIFNSKGEIVHRHPVEKWDKWKDRFRESSSHDWHQHSGKHRGSGGATHTTATATSEKKA